MIWLETPRVSEVTRVFVLARDHRIFLDRCLSDTQPGIVQLWRAGCTAPVVFKKVDVKTWMVSLNVKMFVPVCFSKFSTCSTGAVWLWCLNKKIILHQKLTATRLCSGYSWLSLCKVLSPWLQSRVHSEPIHSLISLTVTSSASHHSHQDIYQAKIIMHC